MRRRVLASVVAMAMCAMWASSSRHVQLLLLREMLRLGEAVGITTASPGRGFAGQILGFNYLRPPAWWGFAALAIAAGTTLALVLLPAAWVRRRIGTGLRNAPGRFPCARGRMPLCIAVSGVVYALIERGCGDWLWSRMFDLGRWLGGSVTVAGRIMVGSRGPFSGSSTADSVGNLLVNHGPMLCARSPHAGPR